MIKLTQLDPLPAPASRVLEVGEDDALRVRHAPLLDELGVEDLELPGVALPLRVEDEDDTVRVPGDGRPIEGSSVKFGRCQDRICYRFL